MNRRHFLSASAATVAASLVYPALNEQQKSSTRPNLLFIMTDQQFADVIGGLNRIEDPLGLKTPNMDRLLKRGVRFEQAYATFPLCVPCRNSVFTGRYPHEIDVNFNRDPEPGFLKVPMMGKLLGEAGYDCGYVGKWHLAIPNTEVETHGFPYIKHALGNGIDPLVFPACRDFLDQRDEKRPFALVASWVNPHDICEVARIEGGMNAKLPNGKLDEDPPLDISKLPPVRTNHALAEDEAPALLKLRENTDQLPYLDRLYPTNDYTETHWRRYMWAYHRLVEKVDAQIGELLDELDVRGLTDNTVVVFTSDHGEGYGSHHWNQKICFYEESARVPFIMCIPGVEGSGCVDADHLVSIGLDILPTLLDFAGTKIPSELPGRSLRPLIEGQNTDPEWRDHIVLQAEFGGFGPHQQTGIKGRCVVAPPFKYVRYFDPASPDEPFNEQLFHLITDPGETKNLAAKLDYRPVLHRLRSQLVAYANKTGDTKRMPLGPDSFPKQPA